MPKKILQFIGIIALFIIITWLVSGIFKDSLQYYVTISELYGDKSRYQKKVIKVAGKASHIQKTETPFGLVYSFDVSEGGKTLQVSYDGLVPDTFREGSDVVVTGLWEGNDIFKAREILAKCASKYEAKIN